MWPYTGIVVDPTRQEQGRHQAGHLRTRDQPKAGTVRARTSYLKLKDAKSRCVRTDACFALSVSPPLQRRLEFARRNHNKHLRWSRPGRNRAFQMHVQLRRCNGECKEHACVGAMQMRRVHDYSIKWMCRMIAYNLTLQVAVAVRPPSISN
jgi:hypothetical protein